MENGNKRYFTCLCYYVLGRVKRTLENIYEEIARAALGRTGVR